MEFISNAVFAETDTSAMQGLSLLITSGALNAKWLDQCENLSHSSDLSSTQELSNQATQIISSVLQTNGIVFLPYNR